MANVQITLTGIEDITRARGFIAPATFLKAQKEGVRYASKAVPPAVAKGITSKYNLKSARVKDDISKVTFAPDGESATIRFSRRPPTLVQFNPNPGRRGRQPGLGRGRGWGPAKPAGQPVRAAVLRGARKPYRGVFITNANSGNRVALKPTDNGGLQSIYGPSIGSIYAGNSAIGDELRNTVEQRIQGQYLKGFERSLNASARGFGGR
jgi:hypothetical protein